ncbi:MAG: phosphoethanolamine transferase, partial [Victivallales bacterium]|jgi:heptose-I-phosphate ethanolaminephosphotransferase|nr:phosphoethanolamine transferase [Victivallales bacterium]
LIRRIFTGRKFTSDTIQAIYQTNLSEALHYFFSDVSCPFILLLLLAFGAGIYLLNRRGENRPAPVVIIIGGALVFLATLFSFYSELFDREALNRTKVLFTDSLEYFSIIDAYAADNDSRLAEVKKQVQPDSGDDGIYVLIIGESHSRKHSSAYGYSLDTTPFLRDIATDSDCILMRNAYSCHVQTMPVLTMLLTSRNQYEKAANPIYPSIFDVANFCGYNTEFISNQYPGGRFDSPIAALASAAKKRVYLNTMEDFLLWKTRKDGDLLNFLPDALNAKRKLVVIQLMGSHGPYFQRYPEDFATELDWKPYDKSVLYTDSLLKELVTTFRKISQVRAAVYVSDHSEIPGVGHAADLFEPQMAEIPMFIYLSEELRQARPELTQNLQRHVEAVFTNDLVFELMLDLMNIRNNFSSNTLRISSKQYSLTHDQALTLWGSHAIYSRVSLK